MTNLKPAEDSRMTAGDINLVVSPNEVERLGFAEVSIIRERIRLVGPSRISVLVSYEGGQTTTSDKVVGNEKSRLVDFLPPILRENGLYLAYATVRERDINSDRLLDETVTGDLYQAKQI